MKKINTTSIKQGLAVDTSSSIVKDLLPFRKDVVSWHSDLAKLNDLIAKILLKGTKEEDFDMAKKELSELKRSIAWESKRGYKALNNAMKYIASK